MTLVIVPRTIDQAIVDAFDTDNELTCWFVGEIEETRITLRDYQFRPMSEMSASAFELSDPLRAKLRAEPDRWELFHGHMHSRKYGNRIEIFDPYFSLPQKEGTPGEIKEGKFYVTRKGPKTVADSGGMSFWCSWGKANSSKTTDKHIFVHPAYGSEGSIMTPALVTVTCYQHDPATIYTVQEIPVVRY